MVCEHEYINISLPIIELATALAASLKSPHFPGDDHSTNLDKAVHSYFICQVFLNENILDRN